MLKEIVIDNGNVNEYSLESEKALTVIPYWRSRSFWVIRDALNEMEAERNWKPGKTFDVISGILLFIFVIVLTYVTSA